MSTLNRAVISLLLSTLLATLTVACKDDESSVDTLVLSVTADATLSGAPLDGLRILLTEDGTNVPTDVRDTGFNMVLGGRLNPAVAPVLVEVVYGGESFGTGRVQALITGRVGNMVAAAFEGEFLLDQNAVVPVHLSAVEAGCDADGDGFLDCAIPGCCSASGSSLSDCEPNDAGANPWGTEEACEPCGDTVDQDCSGGDQP